MVATQPSMGWADRVIHKPSQSTESELANRIGRKLMRVWYGGPIIVGAE